MRKLRLQMHSKKAMKGFLEASKPQKDEIYETGEAHIVLNVNCQFMAKSPFVYSSEFID